MKFFASIVFFLYLSASFVHSSEDITESSTTNSSISNVTVSPQLEGKHESLSTCLSFNLDPDEYELLPNGSAYIQAYNLTLNESLYLIDNETLLFCVPFSSGPAGEKDNVNFTSYLTMIGLGISMVSLLVHLIVFSLVPDLRNLPGCNLAALCVSLFVSYLLLMIISSGRLSENREACIAIASTTHFFLLASFLWMSIMSYDVFLSLLRATGSFRKSNMKFNNRKYCIYCLFAYGISLLFAIFGALFDSLDIVPKEYKPDFKEMCWFNEKIPLLIFFAGPVIALSCLNFIFFGLSAYIIHHNKRKRDQDAQKSVLKGRYLMYFRLSVIMGTTWIVGIVANAVNMDWVWYIFVLLNTLQGFFIFLAFTCSNKVKKYFRQKILGERRSSELPLAPTFQSYCFYANSIEKDMDKIVDCNKDKMDTFMIHL